MTSTIEAKDNHIYYNIEISKAVDPLQIGIFGLIKFNENRTVPIVDKPSDYHLAVTRFNLPAQLIPIFIWPGDDKYFVKMTFGFSTVTKYLQFIPNTTGNDFYGNTIWEYQEMIDILNKALSDAYTDLKALEPTMTPTEAPFMTYDADSKLLKWNIEQLYANTTKVYFSNQMFERYFNSFQVFDLNTDYQMLCKDNGNNSTVINGKNYFSTYQEYRTIDLWSDIKAILFETNRIPTSPEFLSGQKNITRQVLTDFVPTEGINDRSNIQYYPQGPLRYYDLNSNYPLRETDLSLRWEDRNGNTYPLYLQDNEKFTMKLLFRKKL